MLSNLHAKYNRTQFYGHLVDSGSDNIFSKINGSDKKMRREDPILPLFSLSVLEQQGSSGRE